MFLLVQGCGCVWFLVQNKLFEKFLALLFNLILCSLFGHKKRKMFYNYSYNSLKLVFHSFLHIIRWFFLNIFLRQIYSFLCSLPLSNAFSSRKTKGTTNWNHKNGWAGRLKLMGTIITKWKKKEKEDSLSIAFVLKIF